MTCFASDMELDMMRARVEEGHGLSADEGRHLIAEVRRLQEKEGQGRLLVPLLEWEQRVMDQTIGVTMRLPIEEFRRFTREELTLRLDGMAEQVKHTYLRCWESLQR